METAIVQDTERVLQGYPDAGREHLIPILQDVQESQGYLSKEAIITISKHLSLPASKIYGVATFYNQFRFTPNGKFHIQICRGTACHVKGSAAVLDQITKELQVKSGETTRDGLFSLEVVACVGACGLAPVIVVNGEYHAKVKPEEVKGLLEDYRRKASEDDNSKSE